VVAIDTPENLTSRLSGSETLYVQVDAPGADVKQALEAIPGITQVAPADTRGSLSGFEVNSETGRDVRRDLAAAIVRQGWGLLELRPLRMSLEEIFLHLTTEDTVAQGTPDSPSAGPEEAVHE
jgi:ABC-2 type transport system ATP-binding protein